MRYEIPAVRMAVALVKRLAEADRPMGASELARALGTNKNMAFRLLHTLKREGWVVPEDGAKYRLSLQPYHYASKPVARLGLRAAAAGPLRRLWEETGANCYAGVLDRDRVLYVEQFDAVGDIRFVTQVGGRYLLHCSAPGKVLLAHADAALFRRLTRSGFRRNTESTICDPSALRRELDAVARRGYATDFEEYSRGLMCFAAPVYDHADRVAGTVGLTVLTLDYAPEAMVRDLGPKVLRAAERASLQLGMNESAVGRFRQPLDLAAVPRSPAARPLQKSRRQRN
jgi:IclR family acetate operon transcriptional repressor